MKEQACIQNNRPREPWLLDRRQQASGLHQTMEIRPGFALAVCDLQFSENAGAEHRYEAGEYLKFQYKLSGRSLIGAENGELEPLSPGNMFFLVQPKDSIKRERVELNTHERAVTLVCSRDFASNIIPRTADNVPSQIGEYLRDRTSRFSLSSRPLRPAMRAIVEDILNPSISDGLRQVMLEAKTLELLCHTIEQIIHYPAGGTTVRQKDRVKVRELCALIEENPGCTLSIADLSKALAWNETQMMECFKRVTGTTISNYRHKVRMDIAQRELRDTEASITEIAFNAGYEHPSNFATAFKRTFGYPPRMARIR